ncbi:hypothetical protein E2P81_ATG08593 [Venturia nashicola]|nr:hypothetical protein E2P81_ATG08593 [Venturia nashicola]
MKAQTILLLLGTAIASVVPQGAEQLSKVENVFEKKSCVGLNLGEKDQTICMLGGGEKQHRPEVLAEKGRRNNSIQTG